MQVTVCTAEARADQADEPGNARWPAAIQQRHPWPSRSAAVSWHASYRPGHHHRAALRAMPGGTRSGSAASRPWRAVDGAAEQESRRR